MFKSKLKLRTALPDMGKYTIGEDFASMMIEEILQRRPQLIVEAGSGVSTILAAYCLQKIGGGALKSFEHLENYMEDTQNMLVQHELKSVDVKILNAPLCEYTINQEIFYWYSMNNFHVSEKIDMLIVDGPPRATGKLARYPILPLLYKYLSPSAIILLDDANRTDEQAIMNRWLLEYPNLRLRQLNTQKGAALFYHD